MHSPSSRRSPPDGGRDAREVGSVIERTLPVTLPVIVVAVSRWDCGPVGMRASRERLAFSMSVFVSFRGRPRGKKYRARRFASATTTGRIQTLVSGSARLVDVVWRTGWTGRIFRVSSTRGCFAHHEVLKPNHRPLGDTANDTTDARGRRSTSVGAPRGWGTLRVVIAAAGGVDPPRRHARFAFGNTTRDGEIAGEG